MGCENCKLERGGDCSTIVSPVAASQRQDDTLSFLAKVDLFKRLPDEDRPLLADTCTEVTFLPGQDIITQGEEGDAFFVIRVGTAAVSAGGQVVAQLQSGDFFGEQALLFNEPRSATITAETPLRTLKITRERFQGLGLHKKLRFAGRKAVAEGEMPKPKKKGQGSSGSEQGPTAKTSAETNLLENAIMKNRYLHTLVALDEHALKELKDAAFKKSISSGTQVITSGSLDADYFYVVQSGSFEVVLEQGTSRKSTFDVQTGTGTYIGEGGSFGELALLYLAPRAATIVAQEDSVVWTIGRAEFKAILRDASMEAVYKYMKYLDHVEGLKGLSNIQKQEVAQGMVEMSYAKGESIVEQGEVGNTFYIMVDGECQMLKDGSEISRMTANAEHAQTFGERALLNDEPRAATIKVVSESANVLALDRSSFDLIWATMSGKAQPEPRPSQAVLNQRGLVRRKDLKVLGLLGCGGFGLVELVEHVTTGKYYALKSISKGFVVQRGMQKSILSEKDIQFMCDSHFVVKLYDTFNDPQVVLLLLEVALGGDLYGTYNRQGLTGSEEHVRFHLAGVYLALDHLHQKKVVYRDLKPENVLLTEAGHVKLTDLGLAKVVTGRTYTTCGTPDYFAPEVLASKGYQHSVDWWTLGVLLFELMVGYAPFTAPVPLQIFENVTKGMSKVAFPASCSGGSKDLVKALCTKEPSRRLPMRKGGLMNVQVHHFFRTFDWECMKELRMKPPYVPTINGKGDLSNFIANKEDIPPQVPYQDDGSGWDRSFATGS